MKIYVIEVGSTPSNFGPIDGEMFLDQGQAGERAAYLARTPVMFGLTLRVTPYVPLPDPPPPEPEP